MGEAKRRRGQRFNPRNRTPSVAAAWQGYQQLLGGATEREELAFWAGASTLFYALLNTFDDSEEPTAADLEKMDRVNQEIDAFCTTFDERVIAAMSAAPRFERLGDAPVEDEHHAKMIATVRALDELFNGQIGGPGRAIGFVLMVFKFGDTGRCNYMSNGADRRDIVNLMKEMIARFERQPEHPAGRA